MGIFFVNVMDNNLYEIAGGLRKNMENISSNFDSIKNFYKDDQNLEKDLENILKMSLNLYKSLASNKNKRYQAYDSKFIEETITNNKNIIRDTPMSDINQKTKSTNNINKISDEKS